MFEPGVTALHPPELLKPLTQRREVCRSSRIALRIRHEVADQSHSIGILCARRERQRDHHVAKRGDY